MLDVIQQLHHPESKFVDLLVYIVNVGLSEEGQETLLERRSVNISCVQETRFRGKLVRLGSSRV